jgi:hypothetical protein
VKLELKAVPVERLDVSEPDVEEVKVSVNILQGWVRRQAVRLQAEDPGERV